MIELPRYVKRRVKPSGLVTYHYERFRGTPKAWPRILLPHDVHGSEFWARCKQCLALEFDGSSFRWPGDDGRSYDLPDPRDGGSLFWSAVDMAIRAEESTAVGQGKTFRSLIAKYKATNGPYHSDLSDSSRRDYDRYLNAILQAWGDDPVSGLTTVDVQVAIDSYSNSPASGRYFRSVLSRLVAYGIPRGFSMTNVVEHSEKPKQDVNPYEPWPDWALELFFTFSRPALRLAAISALYTGQRKVDVVGMVRPADDADAIGLVARKTKANVWVPIHQGYRKVLADTRIIGIGNVVQIRQAASPLHLREDGEPWSYHGFTTAWQRDLTCTASHMERPSGDDVQKADAMKRIRDAGLVFHGFRKNAVNLLLEAGCTEAEVSSIVEMSEQMVRHYSKDVDKRRLAVNAMRKLEQVWTGVTLPSVNRP